MRKYITNLFDASGKSLNGKVQLDMEEAQHNCHGTPEYVGYEQSTVVYVRDNGTDPVEIVSEEDDYDNQIDITVFWEINDEAEEEDATCDWSEFEVFASDQGFDLATLFAK